MTKRGRARASCYNTPVHDRGVFVWEINVGPHGLFWWIGAGVLVIGELTNGTFYLLMIGLGFVAGGLAHEFGVPLDGQLAIAAAVALAATIALRRSRFNRRRRANGGANPVQNLDIGESLTVAHWHDGRARAMYRGAEWDVVLAPGEAPGAHLYEIVALDGNRLVVAAAKKDGAPRA